ncbi:MAG: hypothetical protein WA194_07315 [Patescibacteria group bacterium]
MTAARSATSSALSRLSSDVWSSMKSCAAPVEDCAAGFGSVTADGGTGTAPIACR